ncbi:hypothetical protein DRO61_08120 [Candidatus Bathyarchaeota archaeon]|jgi:hypothetical protein|nr:MAG: hypothetical protein DRO61_08120 [Candidatus Bathyarchaeota archaeon]
MKDLRKFIINSNIRSLISICDDSDKVALSELLDKYSFDSVDIGDGTIKECKTCGKEKHIELFRVYKSKGGVTNYTDNCADCYAFARAKASLIDNCIKSFDNPYSEEVDNLKSCADCPLSITKTFKCTYDFSVNTYQDRNPNDSECVKCYNHKGEIYDKEENALDEFKKGVNVSITKDHVDLKIVMNNVNRRVIYLKKELNE